jgi:formylmethanofuran dehydrogenase subunit A
MVVLPGGVDAHTHVAGAALNFARAMVPETQRQAVPFLHTPERRMGLGGLTPTTFATGYLYAGMGYTTVTEAAVPVLSAKHTHEELADTPLLDKACLLLMANNEIVMDLLETGETERAGHVVAWLIWAAKTYGIKAVNPGRRGRLEVGQERQGACSTRFEGYRNVTPARIISALAEIIDGLGLPHPCISTRTTSGCRGTSRPPSRR